MKFAAETTRRRLRKSRKCMVASLASGDAHVTGDPEIVIITMRSMLDNTCDMR